MAAARVTSGLQGSSRRRRWSGSHDLKTDKEVGIPRATERGGAGKALWCCGHSPGELPWAGPGQRPAASRRDGLPLRLQPRPVGSLKLAQGEYVHHGNWRRPGVHPTPIQSPPLPFLQPVGLVAWSFLSLRGECEPLGGRACWAESGKVVLHRSRESGCRRGCLTVMSPQLILSQLGLLQSLLINASQAR